MKFEKELEETKMDEEQDSLNISNVIPSMGIVKEIYVEAKKSRNFQTYTFGMHIVCEDNISEEKLEEIGRYWQAKCRGKCNEQIKLDVPK